MTSEIPENAHVGETGDALGSDSSMETDAGFIDDNMWPLQPVTELLKQEITCIETGRNYNSQFDLYHDYDAGDWRHSALFRDQLWSDYKHYLNPSQ